MEADPTRPTRPGICSSRSSNCCAARSRSSIRRSFKDKIVFLGLTASGLVDVFQSPFGSQGTMPGIQLHASMADSILSNRFIRQASDRARVLTTIGRRGAGRSHGGAPALPRCSRGHTAGGVGIHPVLGQGLRQWPVAQHGTTARRHDGGALCRYRLPVLRRGGGKTCRQEAFRPIRFERRLPATHLQPGAGGARRKAPRHDGPFLRYSRFYGDYREGRSGGVGRAAERLFLTDGGDRVSSSGHGRQVRR